MAQHDYVIDNQGAAPARADLNNLFLAIVSQNAGATAPTTTYANMIWYDTATNILKKRNEANTAWISLGTIDETAGTFMPSGGAAIATQAEAEAGTDNTKMMTPLRVFQAIKGLSINVQEFTTAGSFTWTKPADAIYSEIVVVGGGGAGLAGAISSGMCVAPAYANGAGGGAGGGAVLIKLASAMGATETVTVGAAGGTSSFGTHASATGGTSGLTTATSGDARSVGGTGGVGSGTNAQIFQGEHGSAGVTASTQVSLSGSGGASIAGPGGRARAMGLSYNGEAGTRGGGGSGGAIASSAAAGTGGAGGAGYVRVVTYGA